MSKKLEIPTNSEAISPAWLTEALRSTRTINQAAVRSLKRDTTREMPGQFGQLARFMLEYTLTEDDAPASLIAKLSSGDPALRAAAKQRNEREVRFYQEFAAQAQLPTPRCFYSDFDPETGSSILLLEDLSHLQRLDRVAGCNLAQAELVIQNLAKFHAHWWESPQLQANPYRTPIDFKVEEQQELFQAQWPEFPQKVAMAVPGYQLPAAFLELGHQFGLHLAKIFAHLGRRPITCIHRDVHLDNLLFGVAERDVPLVFLDWQGIGYGRGVSDVTPFMIFSVPTPLRRQTEYDLLQTYHRLLVQHGVQGYDFEHCWADYQLASFRILAGLAFVMSMTDVSGDYARRTIAAYLPRVIAFSEDHAVHKFL